MFIIRRGLVKVVKNEEKGSDVNLATCLLIDAFDKAFDAAVVITNDSDLAEPIRVAEIGRILGELGGAAHGAALGELAVVSDRYDDVPIGDREHLVRHDVGVRIADAVRHFPGDKIVERLVAEHADLGIE
jgi:hypothetical protein